MSVREDLAMKLADICSNHDVVPAGLGHIRALAPIMRDADRQEVWAAAGLAPYDALLVSLQSSVASWCWLVEGKPACVFGVSAESILSGVGMPWLLSSPLLPSRPVPFLRYHRAFLAEMLNLFPLLRNWVDARYRLSIRWLRWMGFTLLPAEPYGPFQMLFHPFELRRPS
jgi:hypothetical protein